VLDIVTVFCLVDFQSIGPPNSLNREPSVLFLVVELSLKAASLPRTIASFRVIDSAEYSMA